MKMVLRIKQGFTEKIIDADYVEIEDVDAAEVKDGKWVFRDETN